MRFWKENMHKQFLKYCTEIGLESNAKILLALSGGIDSMALLYLLYESGFSIEVAHCNFQLRGIDSEADEQFIRESCSALNIPVHVKRFDTDKQAKSEGISIQMAARNIRYSWFEELRKECNLDWIATAHHRDDQVETILMNLARGTGLKGMHGILPRQNKIIRPLLFSDRTMIEDWMQEQKHAFREDGSNASLKYVRNKLRHQVVPILKELNPSLSSTIQENTERFAASEINLSYFLEKERGSILKQKGEVQHISISELMKFPAPFSILFYFLSEYGFNDWKAINQILTSDPGKVIFSKTHELLKDRNELVLREIKTQDTNIFEIFEDTEQILVPISLNFNTLDIKNFTLDKSKHLAALDYEKLKFPLALRKWKKGDIFYPLGMRGKKKLSDFFIDEKFSLFEKENIWLLCSQGEIVWVVGHRMDERFKLVEPSQKVYLVKRNID